MSPVDKQTTTTRTTTTTRRDGVIANGNANGTSTAATFPYAPRGVFGTAVPQGATANFGSSYYCGPLCMGGSFIAITLMVALMSWACVSLCCGRSSGSSSGSNGNGGGAPAGSMSSPPPPQYQHQQQRPATAPAASSHSSPPVALSLRPTRYERFEDAPEEQQQQQQQRPQPPPLRPGSAMTPPSNSGTAAGATNPFAASYPAQPPPAWAPHEPLPPPPPPAWPGHGGR